MKVGVVTNKFIISTIRFDGDFHLCEGLEVRKNITKSPFGYKPIGDVTSNIYCPGIFRRNYTKSGVPFLGGGDIQKADLNSGKFLRKKTTPNYDSLQVPKGCTLVTCGGTIGDTVFANDLLAQCWCSQHIMRVIPSDIKEGMLYAYLASKYGHLLLTTNTYGSVIPTLNASNISSLPIPNFPIEFQEAIDSLIQQSAKLRVESTDALGKAIKLFEAVIGKSQVNLGYNSKRISFKSIATRFCRFDSQYQIGKSQLSKFNKTMKIGDLAARIFVGNRGKRNYVSKGVPFLSSSDMMLANPLRSPKNISKNTPSLSEMIVNEGDILISRSGTVGNTIIVGKNLSGVVVSEHAMRLVIDKSKIAPEYVFAYFMTDHGQDALKILPYGSVIVTLGEDFLADVDLPILDKDTYTEIVTLIKEYISKADESVALENSAIDKVEQEIEKWNN